MPQLSPFSWSAIMNRYSARTSYVLTWRGSLLHHIPLSTRKYPLFHSHLLWWTWRCDAESKNHKHNRLRQRKLLNLVFRLTRGLHSVACFHQSSLSSNQVSNSFLSWHLLGSRPGLVASWNFFSLRQRADDFVNEIIKERLQRNALKSNASIVNLSSFGFRRKEWEMTVCVWTDMQEVNDNVLISTNIWTSESSVLQAWTNFLLLNQNIILSARNHSPHGLLVVHQRQNQPKGSPRGLLCLWQVEPPNQRNN